MVTVAVKVPQTLGHVHFWSVDLTRDAAPDDVIEAFTKSSRIVALGARDGLGAVNAVKEWASDVGRPRSDIYEVVLWEDLVTILDGELSYAYMVDNQAIVIPETVDAIRAITGLEPDPEASMARTNRALGIGMDGRV